MDAIITLGISLGLRLIAEGVEHVKQSQVLLEMGCHQGQGFLWSPAIPADQIKH